MDPEERGNDVGSNAKTSTIQSLLDRNMQLSMRLEQVTSDYQMILKQAQNVNVKYENTIKMLKLELEQEKQANVKLRKQLDFTLQIEDLDKSISAVDDVLKTLLEKKKTSVIPPSEPLKPITLPLAKKDPASLSAQELEHIRINQELLKRRQRVNRISFHYAIRDPRFQSGHAQFSHSKEYHCKLRQANKEWKEKIYKLEKTTPGYIDQKYLQLAAENGWPLADTGEDSASSANTSEVEILEEKFTNFDVEPSQPPVLDVNTENYSFDDEKSFALNWAKPSYNTNLNYNQPDSYHAQILENTNNNIGFNTQNRE